MYNKNVRYEKNGFKTVRVPMTIVIGAKCSDGVVIGSDSKGVKFPSNTITEEDKIFSVGDTIVGCAGNSHYTAHIVENLQYAYDENTPQNSQEMSTLYKNVIETLYREDFFNEYGKFKRTLRRNEEDKSIIEEMCTNFFERTERELDFQLIYGSTYTNKGVLDLGLYTTCIKDRYPSPVNTYYPIGVGDKIADYILPRVYDKNTTVAEMIPLVVYVIDQTKKIDNDCGGQIKIKAVTKNGIEEKKDSEINSMVTKIRKIDNLFGQGLVNTLMKQEENNNEDYTREDFLKDLKKVSRPVKKQNDKQKPSSDKT